MWKLVVGFILFAALALFVLSKGGDIDMSGEKHGTETHEAAPAASGAASAAASEPAAAPAASAASGS
ncbi:hypothetical protein ACWA7J_15925 [Leptothrix sp. BB-4]